MVVFWYSRTHRAQSTCTSIQKFSLARLSRFCIFNTGLLSCHCQSFSRRQAEKHAWLTLIWYCQSEWLTICKKFSYSYASGLVKCPLDWQCFALADHLGRQYLQSFRHEWPTANKKNGIHLWKARHQMQTPRNLRSSVHDQWKYRTIEKYWRTNKTPLCNLVWNHKKSCQEHFSVR